MAAEGSSGCRTACRTSELRHSRQSPVPHPTPPEQLFLPLCWGVSAKWSFPQGFVCSSLCPWPRWLFGYQAAHNRSQSH